MSYKVDFIEGQKRKLLVEDDTQLVSVCAYCRVSTDKRDQRNSLAAQKKFFEKEFSKHPNWVGRKVFHDDGISGTSLKKRDGFNQMIDMAKAAELPYCVDLYPYYGSDVGAMWRAGHDVPGALIGPGVHASHGMERTHADALIATVELILMYLGV